MSGGDQEFELLISSEDYLKLQAKCQELELLHEKLETENKGLSLKLLELKEENSALQKNISSMTENVKFLSQKSLNMAKTLIELENQSSNLKISMVESEKQMGLKYKNALVVQRELEAKLGLMITQNSKVKDDLKEKSMSLDKLLSIEKCSRHVQVRPNLIDACNITTLISSDLQDMATKRVEFEGRSSKLQQDVHKLENAVTQLKKSLQHVESQLASSTQKLAQQNSLNVKLSQKINLNTEIQARLVKQVQELECKIKMSLELQSRTQQQKDIFEAQVQKIQKQFEFKCKSLEQMTSQVKQLKDMKQELQKQLTMISQDLKGATMEKSRLAQAIKVLQSKLIEKQNKINSIHTDSEKNKAQKQQMTGAVNRLTIQIQVLVKDNQMLTAQISELKEKQGCLCSELERLKMNLKQSVCQLENFTAQSKAYQDKIRSLQDQRQELLHKVSKYNEEKCLQEKQIADLRKQLDSNTAKANEQVDELIKEFETINQQKIALDKEMKVKTQQFESELRAQKERRVELQQKSSCQQRSLQEKNEKLKLLTKQLKEIESGSEVKNLELVKKCNQLQSNVNQLQSTLVMFNENNQNLKHRCQILQTELKYAQEKAESNKIEIISLKEDLLKQTTKANRSQSLFSQFKAKMNEDKDFSQKRIAILQQELQKITSSKAQMQKEYEKIIQEMEMEKISMGKLKSKDKSGNDQMKQIQKSIEEYFLSMGFNLMEAKLQENDIKGIMTQQMESIADFAKQAIAPFTKEKGKGIMQAKSIG